MGNRRRPGLAAGIVATALVTGGGTALGDPGCNAKVPITNQIQCFLDAAEASNRPAICEQADDRTVRFQCLSLYAEHSLDAAPCERISASDTEAQHLRDACITGVALVRRDPKLCETPQTPGIRDTCYMMLVVQFGADASLCDRIENETLKSACTN